MARLPTLSLVTAGLALAAGCTTPGSRPQPAAPQNAPLSLAMPMVEVPEGTFLYGEDKELRDLDTFWVDKYEVTNAQYLEFVRATGAKAPFLWQGLPPRPSTGEEQFPVRWVSHTDALAYAVWLGKDLPFEEEWEKAARGTDGRNYPWGDEWDKDRFSYYSHGSLTPGPVGNHRQGASPYGAEDMAGNVSEWTNTVGHSNAWYTFYQVRGSTQGSTWPRDLVVTAATSAGENHKLPHGGLPYIGFRCVRRTPPDGSARAEREDGG